MALIWRLAWGLFLIGQVSFPGFAGEPDNFSARQQGGGAVANASLNKIINTVLDIAVDEANASSKSCDQERLMKYIIDDLDRNFPKIYRYVHNTVPVSGPRTADGVPYGKGHPYSFTFFSPSYKVQQKGKTYFVGLDKVDHFFSHGFLYWSALGQSSSPTPTQVKKTLELGVMQEEGVWGLKSSGVKSYADLMANYKGLSFWRDLLGGERPFIQCQEGKFVRAKDFDLEDYFDEGMDESINCNSYKDAEAKNSIAAQLDKWGVECPMKKDSCLELQQRTPSEFKSLLIHPKCLGKNHSQVEEASKFTAADVWQSAKAVASGGETMLGHYFDQIFKKGAGAPKGTIQKGAQ